ncbi:MAG TPA: hypothetical protein EYQ31_01175 [Candidatus Handelsmanbacteria bacterium]|nr:hypothetical protein [Candidatus Latescibacterota bacterium]HIG16008.1 hypothetical protein [Candidatus Handelsmanbacteria bacterium]
MAQAPLSHRPVAGDSYRQPEPERLRRPGCWLPANGSGTGCTCGVRSYNRKRTWSHRARSTAGSRNRNWA